MKINKKLFTVNEVCSTLSKDQTISFLSILIEARNELVASLELVDSNPKNDDAKLDLVNNIETQLVIVNKNINIFNDVLSL
jgi:hypothetical protein